LEAGANEKGFRILDIHDGTSNTFLIGEKHIPLDRLSEGWWDSSVFNAETYSSISRPAGPLAPLSSNLHDYGWSFGSYHPQICLFAIADGTVRPISSQTDPAILALWAQRNDAQVAPAFE